MAEAAAVTSIVEPMINKLGSAVWNELGSIWGVKDDIKKLQRVLSTIRSVLDEAGRRSISDIALCKWLKDLKDVALDADDVVDEFQTEALERKMKGHMPSRRKVRSLFSSRNFVGFRFKMARKIKDVIGRLHEIAEERRNFHLSEGSGSVRPRDRETYSFVVESSVYGRNDDKEMVMKFLTDLDGGSDLSILPIVGLGGVGKTTLAQLVYNDERIKEHFEVQMWVCVMEDFDVKRILKAIIESAKKEECRCSDIDSIQQLVRQQLKDKRFLLILDDVWNEDSMEWERLQALLRGYKCGNKIIVTTRSETVARIVGTVDIPYRLECLSVDDCWMLFRQMAFGPGREEETPKLVEIGKEIIRKCGGLPLAAKSLGSLIASRRGEEEWMEIRNSSIWRLPKGENRILPALGLSYEHLPLELKQCFVYCRLFPKGYKIDRLRLIQLWVNEGLVQSSEEDLHVEDIGNQYFNSLLWRSFFQVEEKDGLGTVVSCKMHDLVHDLACFVASDEYSTMEVGMERSVPLECRYCSVICDYYLLGTLKFSWEPKKLRSLIFLSSTRTYVDPDVEKSLLDTISKLTHLRVLHLSHIRIQNFSGTVAKLKFLRHLDLSFSDIVTLPDSISSLHNLQSLKLSNCLFLKVLPEAISNMSSLRHLDVSNSGLIRMPNRLGRLSGLQMLPLFIVGKGPGYTIAELKHLNVIRGELKIKCLCNVQDPVEAMDAKLRAKSYLQRLELCWVRDEFMSLELLPSRNSMEEGNVLDNLHPPYNLKYLTIANYCGTECPSWLKKYNPSSSFPSMNTVELRNLPNLEEWSVAIEMFPCLQRLVIADCPKLTIQQGMLSSVLDLEVDESNEALFAAGGSLLGFSRVRKLQMTNIKLSESQWAGLQCLIALEELTIGRCNELTCLPPCFLQQRMCRLRTLNLMQNNYLMSLGEGVGRRGEEPPPFFAGLHHLIIWECTALPALPEWLGGLSSLETLTLRFCSNLTMLPDRFHQLRGLRRLTVDNCRLLARRCEKETGEDWHKIAHIPVIQNVNVWWQ